MHFLITNDDGYGSAGIIALEKCLLSLGEVTVVAPDRHLSGCSHQVTTDYAIPIKRHGPRHYAIGGMPADCVRLGLLQLAPDCDWVVSGINEGANLGCDLYYSGTVAAAREAALLGRRAIAVSHYHTLPRSIDWDQAGKCCRPILQSLLAVASPPPLWNVNLPAPDYLHGDTPVRRCSIDPNPLAVTFDFTPDEARYCHGRYHDRPRTPGSDVDVCFGGQIAISAVPLYGIEPRQ